MIPKIIHQVWEGRSDPLPDFYKQLGETWKKHHPDWKYEFWNGDRMETFIENNFPYFTDTYFNFKYNIQRWDVIRYLILYKIGGMYVDFDYECLKPFDDHIIGKEKCYFAMDPNEHSRAFRKDIYFNNALMITAPGHPFFEHIINHIQNTTIIYSESKFRDVLSSTRPLMPTNLYEEYGDKTIIDFFAPKLTSPWSQMEVRAYLTRNADVEKLDKKLEKAIAIHYFSGSW